MNQLDVAPKKITDVFAVMTPDQFVKTIPLSPTLYEQLDVDFNGFRAHVLVSCHEFDEDWSTWEKHPAGDEIVLLLSGNATIVLRTPAGDESIALDEAGTYIVVPRDTWHTAKVSEPTRMLFITPGEGTQNEAEP